MYVYFTFRIFQCNNLKMTIGGSVILKIIDKCETLAVDLVSSLMSHRLKDLQYSSVN